MLSLEFLKWKLSKSNTIRTKDLIVFLIYGGIPVLTVASYYFYGNALCNTCDMTILGCIQIAMCVLYACGCLGTLGLWSSMMEDGFGDDKTYGKIMLALSALYILALLYGIGVFSMSFMPEQLAPVAQHQVVEYQQVCKNGVCNWMRME